MSVCRFFFTYLLPHSAPSALRPLLDNIVNATGQFASRQELPLCSLSAFSLSLYLVVNQ